MFLMRSNQTDSQYEKPRVHELIRVIGWRLVAPFYVERLPDDFIYHQYDLLLIIACRGVIVVHFSGQPIPRARTVSLPKLRNLFPSKPATDTIEL